MKWKLFQSFKLTRDADAAQHSHHIDYIQDLRITRSSCKIYINNRFHMNKFICIMLSDLNFVPILIPDYFYSCIV